MLIRVAFPEVEALEIFGDIKTLNGNYSRLKVLSLGSRKLSVGFAIFKESPTGKEFGRFYKRKWDLVDICHDISEAYGKAKDVKGEFRVWVEGWGGNLEVFTDKGRIVMDSPLMVKNTGKIKIKNIWVGKGFHWQRREDIEVKGDLHIYAWGRNVRAVNVVPLEDYISSVIGSEMSPRAPFEALKAQALAARTNLYKTAGSHHPNEPFDICSEDHCQVYLGLKNVSCETLGASRETEKEIITYGGTPIEARYSKCCGGIMERFSVVWGEEDKPYAINKFDNYKGGFGDVSSEENFMEFFNNFEDAFCNFKFGDIDNLYRWEVLIPNEEMIKRGIVSVEPVRRGASGRLFEVEIKTLSGTFTISGEYKIREYLGKPFLPSSAFYVVYTEKGILLKGCGWGHGVGMCQMGAIRMALKGYNYKQIINHYYPGTEISVIP